MAEAADEPRRQHARFRVDGHELHRRQLLAGLHEADLGGERGAGAAGEEQRSDHRPEFTHQRQVDDETQVLGRAVGHQRVIHLQGQHEAHGRARGQDDGQRAVTDGVHLRHYEAEAAQRSRRRTQQVHEEEGRMAPAAELLQCHGAQAGQHLHQAFTPKSAPISGAG